MANPARAIELPDDLRAVAEERVRSGEYDSVEDVVRDAFSALEARTNEERQRLEALREEARKGFEQLDEGLGRFASAVELVARLRERRERSQT